MIVKIPKIACALLVLLYLGVFFVQAQETNGTDSESIRSDRKEAEKIWEKAIEAKGGREKLYSVRNMFESLGTTFFSGFKKITKRNEALFVLPNKSWVWDDNRPSVFGLEMTMYNLDSRKKYYVRQGQKKAELETIASDVKSTNLSGLVYVLMETKYNQPIPEKVIEDKVSGQVVDIVQTNLLGNRIDFYLDRKTYLPLKVVGYIDQKISYENEFSDYIDVNGIKMASVQIMGGEKDFHKTKYKVNYQFNVEYDESIFITPPLPVETAADAWKVKK